MSPKIRIGARIVLALTTLLLFAPDSRAQDREWKKTHFTITMEQVFAEYTEISTDDTLSPQISRYLYRDANGVGLVIRDSTDVLVSDGEITGITGSFTSSITLLTNGEKISLSRDASGTVTVVVGAGSFSYVDSEANRPLSQAVKQQALSVITANASTDFRAALGRFAHVGGEYSNDLFELGYELGELFFGAMFLPPTDYTSPPTDAVSPFDPNVTPPGPFEQPFGQAYYQ